MKLFLYLLFTILSFSFFAQSFSPENHFGYKIGAKFTPHHDVISFFEALQTNYSSNIKIEKYGKTNENRDLILAYIGTDENIAKLEQIKSEHKAGIKSEKISIVWLSYNVHGNEASCTEAAMQTAFDLITKNNSYLKNTIVIIDPCLNPDGRDRYVNWYYQFKTKNANPNPDAVEHDEPWPGGRPNHYFFDLNRDWAWLTQVESQQRIKKYNEWLPHVHVDFHEQGINEPYYFPPAAEPYHEIITEWQREFQKGIGKNNAKYFDEKGWQYFTSKEFDLLYPSYGDTYPTFCGAIGMTYEQAGNGRAGEGIITRDGDTLTLKERVEHHVVTGISTVEYSAKMSDKLIQEYQKFVKDRKFKFKSYVIEGKIQQVEKLGDLFSKHDINYSFLPIGQKIKGFEFDTRKTGSFTTENVSLLVNLNQLKGTLAHVLLEPETKLADSLTYDITSWTLPFAYGLKAYGLENEMNVPNFEPTLAPAEVLSSNAYAYVVRWEGMNSVQFLNQALADGIVVRKHAKGFEQGNAKYTAGSLIILKSENSADVAGKLQKIASKFQINISQTMSGMVDKGSDFGYSDVEIIKKPKIALLVGDKTNSLNVGEIWHFLENDLNLPITLLSLSNLKSEDLDEFSMLFVPEGYYETNSFLSTWIDGGGKAISFGSSIESLGVSLGLSATTSDEEKTSDEEEVKAPKAKKEKKEDVSFADAERSSLSTNVIGAIYRCKLDQTHPLCFGIENYYTLRQSSDSYKKLENGFSPVSIAQSTDHMNGFVGYKVKLQQANSIVAGTQSKGKGQVIIFTDNPLYRGFWESGKMLVANAIYQAD